MLHNQMQSKRLILKRLVYLALMTFISRLHYVVYGFRFTCVVMAAFYRTILTFMNSANYELYNSQFLLYASCIVFS